MFSNFIWLSNIFLTPHSTICIFDALFLNKIYVRFSTTIYPRDQAFTFDDVLGRRLTKFSKCHLKTLSVLWWWSQQVAWLGLLNVWSKLKKNAKMHCRNLESCISFALKVACFSARPLFFVYSSKSIQDSHQAKVKESFNLSGFRNSVASQYHRRFLHIAMYILCMNHKIRCSTSCIHCARVANVYPQMAGHGGDT